jgi:hypothetical protein
MSEYSKMLCIPRISRKCSRKAIESAFEKFNLGTIEKYRENSSKSNTDYKRVMFQLKWNQENEKISMYQSILEENKSLKLVYDFPWFWIMVVCKSQPLTNTRPL